MTPEQYIRECEKLRAALDGTQQMATDLWNETKEHLGAELDIHGIACILSHDLILDIRSCYTNIDVLVGKLHEEIEKRVNASPHLPH